MKEICRPAKSCATVTVFADDGGAKQSAKRQKAKKD
jgi:hypothetical protein